MKLSPTIIITFTIYFSISILSFSEFALSQSITPCTQAHLRSILPKVTLESKKQCYNKAFDIADCAQTIDILSSGILSFYLSLELLGPTLHCDALIYRWNHYAHKELKTIEISLNSQGQAIFKKTFYEYSELHNKTS